jgi:hypothetical protein
MKNRILLTLLFITILHGLLNAGEININDARKVALNIVMAKTDFQNGSLKSNLSIASEFTVQKGSLNVYYIFNLTSGGWVIISADDRVTPILAYSYTGSFDTDMKSPELKWWMDGYADQVSGVVENNIAANSEIQTAWNQLLSGSVPVEIKGAKNITPLLTSTWDQGTVYNMLCPEDPGGPGGHVWTGCVATSMSQVMYYYRYPLQGNGSHGYNSNYGYLYADFGNTTYDWNAMQNRIYNTYNYPMALLQYHCGIAVDMMYSPDGSGAYMWDATQALIDYFGYSPSMHLDQKDDYTESEWKTKLKAELDAERPLCYAGYGDGGGHAFVCDGYDGTDHFHFNWGWSGYYDGYYYVSNLNPGYTFNDGQQAIFGMVPASGFPYGCSGTTNISSVQGSFEDGSGPVENYTANGDCSWLIHPDIQVDHIRLTFDRFDTENTNDVVTVFDGGSTSDSVLGVFSGSSIPPVIESTGDQLLVNFTTNSINNSPGWFASFTTEFPEYCTLLSELTAPSGSFSDGSGSNEYVNSTVCRWRIDPPGATGITINFSSLDLGDLDFVKVYDEISNTAIGAFYGTTIPSSVYVFTSKVLVLFMTNGLGTAQGFEANYTSGTDGIINNDQLKGLCVYPNPAKDKLHISSGATGATPAIIRLMTYTGTEVYQTTAVPFNNSIDKVIDVSSFSEGLYFICIESAGTRQMTKLNIIH